MGYEPEVLEGNNTLLSGDERVVDHRTSTCSPRTTTKCTVRFAVSFFTRFNGQKL